MSSTALVTGANGFIGRHAARALAARGYRVIGIGYGEWERSEWREWGLEEWYLSDVSPEALNTYAGEPDIIVHCAGSGSVSFSLSDPLTDFRWTVATAIAVLDFMRAAAPNAGLVIPSSAAVYGMADSMPITLGTPLHPVSPYGVHKKIVEELCSSYATHFGVRVAVVRLFSVYGIGLRKQLLWDSCTKMQAGNFSFMGTGRETRDLLHVEDAVQLMLAAAIHASAACPIVNGGCGEAIEIHTILEAVASALGAQRAASFSGVERAGDPLHYQADITEALELGWKPSRDWRREISAYAAWFKAGAL